jgi:ABC-type transport system substrate-binding protein
MDPVYGLDRSGYEDIVPGSVVVGEKSFRFVLSRPSLVVESLFSVLLPAHVVAGTDLMADWNDRMWVSGGPFQFESWTPATEEDLFSTIILTRNDAYWKVDGDTGQQLPFLDRVVFRFVGDVDTLVAEFEARRLDVITPGADAAILDHLAALEGVVVDVVGNGQWEHLSFQFGQGRLTRNPGSYNSHLEFRRAVAHAVDRDRVAAELFGSWGVGMDSYVEAFTPGWSQAAWAQYDYDPDAARTALAELCAKPDIDCTTNPPTVVFTAQSADLRIRLSEILEPMFTEVGIAFRAELDPALVFFGSTLDFGRYDLGLQLEGLARSGPFAAHARRLTRRHPAAGARLRALGRPCRDRSRGGGIQPRTVLGDRRQHPAL